MPRAARLPLRMVTIGLLCVLAGLVLWRGLRLGWLAWQGVEAAQRLRADSGVDSSVDVTGGQAVLAERLPRLQGDLLVLSERLDALDAELQPLAPAARALAGLLDYGGTIAGAPDLVASANRLAATAAAMRPQLAWLLGVDAPRTYLLLVQNNHELRATGGFLSAFGTLVVDQGTIVDLAFVDSYELFSTEHEYPPAPAPMQKYMGIQLLTPRDANWSPDLPTAVKTIRKLYMQETGLAVDGIITVDLDAVRHLVKVLGSVSLAGVPTPITAENVEQELVRLWEQPVEQDDGGGATGDWWAQRKDFVPLVAGAALAKLQAGEFAASRLPAELTAALDGRSLQVWLDQPQLEQVLVEQGWDGGLHPPASGDFLAVVDSNVGYNKVDAAMQRGLQYAVTWPRGADQKAQVSLTLTYTQPVVAEDPGCDSAPRYGAGYADLIARCYFDYVRVFAPTGSELVDVSGIDPQTVSSTAGEGGTQQFAGYFVLPPGNSKSITFTYRLPVGIVPEGYTLRVQRQAGTDALPVRVVVNGVERATTIEGGEWEW
jgi:hypothetical protein